MAASATTEMVEKAAALPPKKKRWISWGPPLVWMGIIGLLVERVGGYWDGSWHLEHVRDFEITPPHIVLYTGGMMILVTAIASLVTLIRNGGLREGIRRNPAIALVAFCSFLQISSAPLDNLWHELFGIDVTVWSPPHAFLIVGMGAICVTLAVLQGTYIHQNKLDGGLDGRDWNMYRIFQAFLMSAFLQAVLVFVVEPEMPGIPFDHPFFGLMKASYTTVVAGFAMFALVATIRVIRRPFAATIATAWFTLFRAGMGLLLTGHMHAAGPAGILLPALAFDLIILRNQSRGRVMIGAVVFAILLTLVEPPYTTYITGLPPLTYQGVLPWLPAAIAAAVVFGALGYPVGNFLARLSLGTNAATELSPELLAGQAISMGQAPARRKRITLLEGILAGITVLTLIAVGVPLFFQITGASTVDAINSAQKIRASLDRFYYEHNRNYPDDIATWDDLRTRLGKYDAIPANGSSWSLNLNGTSSTFVYRALDNKQSYFLCLGVASSQPSRLIVLPEKVITEPGTCQGVPPVDPFAPAT